MAQGRVDGKVVLITGGARGMGAAHARLLAAEGARVLIADVLADDGAALAAELGDDRARFVPLDVTDPDAWDRAVREIVEAEGRIDVLVNNAGIGARGRVDDIAVADWDRIIAINLTGPLLGMRAVAPAMRAAGGGSMINISSTAGLRGLPNAVGYVASKWGVRGLSKAAALDLGGDGIRVNSVHPGIIRTPLTAGADERPAHVALHRIGEAEEVSELVLYLASDASRFVTGAEFVIDGGETAGRL
jgi:3alpha(or 20beta)-hydroxysteroid dehydrogenase